MRCVVTGGAGFLGINLVRRLLADGHDVVSFDLAGFPDAIDSPKFRSLRGDIRDAASVNEAMRQGDVVVHAAAALPRYRREDIFSTDVEGTRRVLEAALARGVERVIFLSSTAVYGIPDHHPLLEDDRLQGVGPYGQAKIQAEAVCREFRGRGLCVPILRPKSFIGPERLGIFALLYDWARSGKNFPILGKGDNRFQLLAVEDLCDAILLSATLPAETVNDVFNIGTEDYTTMRQDLQAVLDQAGFGKRIIGFPSAPAIAALRLLDALHASPLYSWVYETAGKDSYVSIEKAKRVLGFRPKLSNQDALIRNYEWYKAHFREFEGKSGNTHRVPWDQGALRLLKLFF